MNPSCTSPSVTKSKSKRRHHQIRLRWKRRWKNKKAGQQETYGRQMTPV